MEQYEAIKQLILEDLFSRHATAIVNLWFGDMVIEDIDNNKMTVSFPENRRMFAEGQYGDSLQTAVDKVMQMHMTLNIRSRSKNPGAAEPEPEAEPAPKTAYAERFNPNFTFDNFIVGKSNKLAQMSAKAVAEHPFNLNNPLYLYGPPGLGKTHLLFAIVNELRKNHPEYKILYVSSEEFTNELMEGLAQHKPVAFRDKYRSLDVLLVDDIQFMAGKLSTMEEFFHTFETLYHDNKQLIIASDKPPQEIQNLDERLKTRCSMGLVADIQPPDLELRTAIFRRKALDYGFDVDYSVLSYLAEHITKNIRQIEGALKKLRANCLITGDKCTVQMAERVLGEFLKSQDTEESIADKAIALTSKRYNVTEEDLLGQKRSAGIAFARHFAIYLIRKTTNLSQKQIAEIFHKKDHTTVMNSINVIEEKIHTDPIFAREVALLTDELKK